MTKSLLWRGLLGIILMIAMSGCSYVLNSKAEGSNDRSAVTSGPHLSYYLGDTEFTGSPTIQLSSMYRKGVTLLELLRSSGVALFDNDGKDLLSVSRVTLAPGMTWGLGVGSKLLDPEEWSYVVTPDDSIRIIAMPASVSEANSFIVLYVNGSSDQPELTHSYILPYVEEYSVRSFLKSSGLVEIAEDNRTVLTAKEYTPLTDQVWKVKVNGKLLLENGMDMKLRPQDEVEVVLNIRLR